MITVLGITSLYSCKKNLINLDGNQYYLNKNQISSLSYNVTYDVLVFPSTDAVEALTEDLINQEKNYQFDKGNKMMILDKFEDILQYGYTNGNGNGFGADDGGVVTRHRLQFDGQLTPIYTISL